MAERRCEWLDLITVLSRPTKSLATFIALIAITLLGACTGEPEPEAKTPEPELSSVTSKANSYEASWLVEANAAGHPEVGSYVFTEIVDGASGRFFVRTATHLALQTPEEVVFCAAIGRPAPYCATAPRADGVPHTLSYPIQRLNEWRPDNLFELASYRQLVLVSGEDPDNWTREKQTISNRTLDCFIAGDTPAARPGFTACFTTDQRRLIALLDVQGDSRTEVLLVEDLPVMSDSFVTDLEEFYEARPLLQERLLEIYPELPVEKPTPTSGQPEDS